MNDSLNAVQFEPHLDTDVDESAGGGEDHVRVGVDAGELLLYRVPAQHTRVGHTWRGERA